MTRRRSVFLHDHGLHLDVLPLHSWVLRCSLDLQAIVHASRRTGPPPSFHELLLELVDRLPVGACLRVPLQGLDETLLRIPPSFGRGFHLAFRRWVLGTAPDCCIPVSPPARPGVGAHALFHVLVDEPPAEAAVELVELASSIHSAARRQGS